MREQTAVTELRRERDRARGIAVELEQQIAAALVWHQPRDKAADSSVVAGTYCGCGFAWPCPTRRALDPAVDE